MAVAVMEHKFSELNCIRGQLKFIFNAVIASSKIRKIAIHNEQNADVFQLDKALTTVLFAPPGYTKTTIFKHIARNYGPRAHLMNRYTKASFEGTIDEGVFHPPSIWGKDLIILDETNWEHLGGSAATLLSLTDGGFIDKNLARGVEHMRKITMRDKKDKRAKLVVDKGNIHMEKVISVIMGSMFDYVPKNTDMMALFSRSIPIWVQPRKKLIFEIVRGNPLYKYHDLPVRSEYEVAGEDSEFIIKFVEDRFTAPDLQWVDPEGIVAARTIADLTILFCIYGDAKEHPVALYEFVMHQKRRMLQALRSSQEALRKVVPWNEQYAGFSNNEASLQ